MKRMFLTAKQQAWKFGRTSLYHSILALLLFICGCILFSFVPKNGASPIFDVRDFGAVGDSITINTRAIQQAVERCYKEGGGVVLVTDGVYTSGAIFLKDNVHLKIEKNAKLKAVPGNSNYPILSATRIAGIEMDWPSAFINALDVKNVKIYGAGTIDGAGYHWWANYWIKRDSLLKKGIHADAVDWHVQRPRLVLFDNVTNGEISGLTLMNSAFWTVHVCYSSDVNLYGLRIINPVLEEGKKAASSDGIDVDSSKDITIRDCYISVDDDCIAIKSGRGSDGLRVGIPSENVLIENCFFANGHGGVSIGTETAGGIKNVIARKCVADGNSGPIKLKPRPGRGGVIDNIRFEQWEIANAGTVIDYAFRNVDGKDYIDEWFGTVVPFAQATPKYQNLIFQNIKAVSAKNAIRFMGWPLARVKNVMMKNVTINAENGGEFQFIDSLILNNVNIKASKGVPIQTKDVKGYNLSKVGSP